MAQSGDWLDRTMAFVAGFLGTFIALTIAWALIETFTSFRFQLGDSRSAVVVIQGAISLAVAIWRARRAGRRSAAPQIAGQASSVALPKAGVRPVTAEDRAMAEAMLKSMVQQVRREAELRDGTWPVPLSVRLEPQIPIRDHAAPRSWLGGRPRIPAAMPWPEIEGTSCDFIAQIALAELPAELWHGLGPRDGWLALFLHPTSYRGHLLHISELGPARDAPNPPADVDGWYNPYGLHRKDAVQERYMIRAVPQWPVDLVVIPAQESEQEEGKSGELGHAFYKNGFDLVDRAHHPFDWPGMLALVDSALAVLERRYAPELPSPNLLEQQLAAVEARLAAGSYVTEAGKEPTPFTPEQIATIQRSAASLRELIPIAAEARRMGLSAQAAVRQIAADVHEQAKRLPFSPELAEALLTDMQAINWMHITRHSDPKRGPGAEVIEPRIFPITVHNADAPLFAWDYHVLHFDMARHAYCRDMASVPAVTRTLYEPIWRDLNVGRTPKLGGFPRAHVNDFSPDIHVIALEVPSNQPLGWMFGDVDDLVLLMTQEQIAAGRFAEASYEASN